MGFLQRWLDEPDESIARHAKTFYLLTFLFMAVFVVQMAQVVWDSSKGTAALSDFVGPCVSVFLALVMYNLAIDGRRSYKAVKAAPEATAPPDPRPQDA